MCQTIIIDPKTIVIKSDDEDEISEILDSIGKREKKKKSIKEFLEFAAKNRKLPGDFKFNREECHER